MANTYTWIGAPGTAAFGTITSDWTPSGSPQAGDIGILTNGGTILLGNGQLHSNTRVLGNGLLVFAGDTQDTIGSPTLDGPTLITTKNSTLAAQSSTIDALGNFVNAGTILADGASGSTLTINVGTTVINGTTVAGYSYNTGTIQADAGNAVTINIGASSELLNSGYIVADGGSIRITAAPSAISGGVAAVNSFFIIEDGGTLETQASYPLVNGNQPGGVTPRYEFGEVTSGNTLKIDNLGSFGGSVIGFQAGDTVDLGTSIAIANVVYSTTTSLLEFENATGTILESLFLSTNGMTTGTFAVTGGEADGLIIKPGVDGDTVVTTDRTFPNASGVSGAWQNAASWNGGSIPAATDTAAIGLGETANFTLTTGSAPVSVLGISMFDPSASLQITSDTTATPGIVNLYTGGTLEVEGGNTLTSTSLRTFGSTSSILVAPGGTVAVTGREGTSLAATAGTIAITQSNSSAVEVAGGTLTVDGALLAGPAASGQGGDFTIGEDSAGLPASVIVNGDGIPGDGQVTDTFTLLGSDPTSSGTLTLNGGGVNWTDEIDTKDTSNSRGYMDVGFNNLSSNTPVGLAPPPLAQPAEVLVESGATLTEQAGAGIGVSPESAGDVTITGPHSVWNIGTPGTGTGLGVGDAGSATLSVLNGGTVAIYGGGTFLSNGTTFPSAGGIGVGQTAGGSGTVIVSGTGSELSSVNGMAVAKSGQALLSITNGGTVTITGNGIGVGETAGAGSSGTIDVGGSGAPAALDFTAASGTLPAASGMTVGSASRGTLNVSDNGTVNLSGTGGITVGGSVGSFGTVTIGGSTASAVVNFSTNGMTVGQAGTGDLTINSLGTIEMNGTGGITTGITAGAVGSITVDGGLLTEGASSNGIGVGNVASTTASLLVENSGVVSLAGGNLQAGVSGGSNGTVTVSGAGSSLQSNGTAWVIIGNSGTGTLNVNNGGSLDMTQTGHISVGFSGGSSGQMTVSGGTVTSAASATSGIVVGSSGRGTLTVSNNGLVNDAQGLDLGLNGGGSGSVLISSGAITAALVAVGQSGSGTLAVSGGTITTAGVFGLGINNGATGTATISAGGSVIARGGIDVGEGGAGTLAIQGDSLSVPSLGLGGSAITPMGNQINRATLTNASDLEITGALAVWYGSTLSVDSTSGIDVGTSGSFIPGAINLESGHTITGGGFIPLPVQNNGVIEASGSAVPGPTNFNGLDIQGAITGSGSLKIDAGAVLRLDAAVPSNEPIQFSSGSGLILTSPGAALTNQVSNLFDGDRIELNFGAGVSITNIGTTGIGTVVVTLSTSGTYDLTNLSFINGSGTTFYHGVDSNTGFQFIEVATPTDNWTGNAGNKLYSDAGNWSAGVPTPSEQVNFNANPGTVTGSGAALSVNIGPYNSANSNLWTFNTLTLTVSGSPGSPYLPFGVGFYANTVINGGSLNSAAGGANIGNVDGVTVTAQNSAIVTTLDDNVGTTSGQAGSLVLIGSGTDWSEETGPTVGGNVPGYISLGYGGPPNGQSGSAGYLTVTSGAVLNTGGSGNIAGGTGSFGSATVSAGGLWSLGTGLTVGGSGTGALSISGGTVSPTGYVGIGQNTGGVGAVSVTNGGVFNAGTALTVGQQGNGTLTVSTGTVSTTGALVLGGNLGAFGEVTLTNGGITASGGMQVGGSGNGLMTISTGGLLQFGGTYNPVAGSPATEATLVIVNGGTAEAIQAPGTNTVMQIGNAGATSSLDGSTGTVIVADSGSLLNLNGNAVSVGNGGNGALEVYSGATVDAGVTNSNSNAALNAGASPGSDGQIIVSGTGASSGKATLNLGGYVGIAQGGDANLTVDGGGLVAITNAATNGTGLGIGVGNSGNAANIGGQGEADVTGGGILTDQGNITVGGNGVSGVLNVSGGTVSTVTGLTAGTASNIGGTVYGGSGSVNIGAGGTVAVTEAPQQNNFAVEIGTASANVGLSTGDASGSVLVSGAGALLNTNGNGLEIGRDSIGDLSVSQGGTVLTGTPNSDNIAAIAVGRYGTGNLTISDPGSSVTADGAVNVGRAGTGTLLIENDGKLVSDPDGAGDASVNIGIGVGTGTSYIVGGSGNALVTTGGSLYSAQNVVVGVYGVSGALTVANSGTVEAGTRFLIGADVTVAAGDTIVSPSGTTIASGSTILSGTGLVTVGAGGLLKADGTNIASAGTSDIVVGDGVGASAALNVTGAGATVNSEGYRIGVGAVGQGSLLIALGGTVLAGTPFAADDAIFAGGSAGATGAVTVSDPGSELHAVGQLAVGLSGQGSLLIENQGTAITGANSVDATEGVDIGQNAGASGTATVNGVQSLLTNTGQFIVGDSGVGNLAIGSGGTVNTSPGTAAGLDGLDIANTASASGSGVNVTGAGSQLNVTGLLDVGISGSGALAVNNGATVTAGSLDAGNIASATGQVSVSGTGSELSVNGPATVADDGTGVLSVLSGATFAATTLTIGNQADSSGALVVSGDGSVIQIAGALNIGTANGTGDITVGPNGAVHAGVVNLQGQAVVEGGLLDPTVQLIGQGQTAGGFGTISAGDIIDEGVVQAGQSKASQRRLLVQGTLIGGGTLTINGTEQPSKPSGELQINAGGTLELTGAVLNAATTTFTDNLTPADTYTVTNSVMDVNFADAAGVLTLDDIAGFAGTIVTDEIGDRFVITGGTLSGLTVSNSNTLQFSDSGAGAGAGGIDQIIFASPISASGFNIVNGNTVQVACFAEGTRIQTDRGPVAVEDLNLGHRVITNDGAAEPIVWIGQRSVNCQAHPRPETVWPVRVRAGAFGSGPMRDLWLSPDHAVFVNNVLVPVKLLIDGTSIAQMPWNDVRYFHVELPRHAIILAEGLTVESYLDTGGRTNFNSDTGTIRLFADFSPPPETALLWETQGAAPLVTTGDALEAARLMIQSPDGGEETQSRAAA